MATSVCSPSDSGHPLEERTRLIEQLERQEAIRRAKERQNQLAALSHYVLNRDGSTES